MVPRVYKSRMGGRLSTIRSLSLVELDVREADTLSPLRLGLKLSFLTKLIVGDGSGDPETSHSIDIDCWGTSHDTPFLTSFSFALKIKPAKGVNSQPNGEQYMSYIVESHRN